MFQRTDPEVESLPEQYGKYQYFLKHKEWTKVQYPSSKKDDEDNHYSIYCRLDSTLQDIKSQEDLDSKIEVVLDLEEVPFIP